MKQKTVGVYSDGTKTYKLLLAEGDDSCAWNSLGVVRVGVDFQNPSELFDNLLHEIQEDICNTMGLRHKPTSQQVRFGGKIMFIFDHAEYCELCSRVSNFMSVAWPDLLKAWKTWRKK